jgi:hypothetical protein
MTHDSSGSIVTGYGLENWGSIMGRCRNFSLCHHVQTISGVQPPTSYPVDTGYLSTGIKDRTVKLTTHLCIVLRLRMCGAIS